MSSEATCPITLTVAGDPRLARLVRMTAANVGALCSMSVDRIEDIRMAAEEAFIFGCGVCRAHPRERVRLLRKDYGAPDAFPRPQGGYLI